MEEVNRVEEAAIKYGIAEDDSKEVSMLSLIKKAQLGIPVSAFFELSELSNITKEELATLLDVSSKTMSRYQKSNKTLSAQHSEHILKLINLYKKGQFVFSSTDSFNRWLHKPAYGLYGKAPYSFMQTSGGVDIILEELGRIEHGAFS